MVTREPIGHVLLHQAGAFANSGEVPARCDGLSNARGATMLEPFAQRGVWVARALDDLLRD
eukprot:16082462-Heterocapsa_arctica.AAC.1